MNPEQALATRAQRTTQLQNKQQLDRLTSLEKTFVSSMRQLVQFLDGKTTKTEVLNQLKDYASNKDINKVVSALEQLGKNVSDSKLDITPLTKGLNALEEQLKKLPTEYPEYEAIEEVTVKNQIDLKPLEKAIKSLKLEAPKVDVAAPNVKVDAPDLKPLQDSLLDVVKAIKDQELPITDLKDVEKKLDESNKHLKKLVEKPVGGGGGGSGVSFQDSSGKQVRVTVDGSGNVPVSGTVTAITATSNYITRLDDTTTANVTYVGKAALGSATSAAVWQIQKIDETSGMVITWGGTGAFDQVWDNRATTVVYA